MQSKNPQRMDSKRWKQIESLYYSAIQLDAAARDDFLARSCAGDESLRQELLSLLSSADIDDSFLEESALKLGLAVMGIQQETLVGQNVGRYRLLEHLGRGGMGEVYLAHDPRLNRRVALKLLPASIQDDRERVLRFEQEARAASAISHPNIAHVYEIGEVRRRHYIAMEYVEGKTLRQILKQGALNIDKTLDITIQVLIALSAAHRVGVIHRDIKPENIMLRDDGYVKVLDFGLAKLAESDSAASNIEPQSLLSLHTDPGLLMGTSHYMSPEQIRRHPVDARMDLWSVGVVLYEMLTGRRPFYGASANDIFIDILEREPEPLSHKRPELPLTLQPFICKALRKKPGERYQTVDTMLADFRQIARQLEHSRNATASITLYPSTLTSERLAHATAEPLALSTNKHLQTDAILEISLPAQTSAPRRSYLTQGWRWVIVAPPVLLIIVGLYFALFYGSRRDLQSRNFNLQFKRLNMSGNISDIIISPDGKYVASVVAEQGKQAIHITELATSSDLTIVSPSDKAYSGLSFSPDSNYVYYLENQTETGTLYRVSKLGGSQRKILNNVNTPVTFSPNGQQIAFVRSNIAEDTPDLIISQADGADEQTLARRTRKDADVFPADVNGVGPVWSPDGKMLACVTINRSSNPHEMNLEVFDIAGHHSRRLNTTPWYDISRLSWLGDGSGLVVAAAESLGAPWQLALVSFPKGEVRKLTNDPNNYIRISTTLDLNTFLTLKVEENTSIWLTSLNDNRQFTPFNVRQKKGVSEIVWNPDGKLIYTVSDGENLNLWLQERDGNTAHQLTFEGNKNFRPMISPDERYIVFASSRAGRVNIWRMEMNGTNLKQLTFGTYEDMPTMTRDGKWIIYRTGSSVMKVSVDGGDSIKLFDKKALYPMISPDGRLLALFTNDKPDSYKWYLEVFDLSSLARLSRFELAAASKPFNGLRWEPNGRGLIYISSADGAENLWMQPLKGGEPKPLTSFRDAEILSFAWSPSSDQIACIRSAKTYIPLLIKPFER